MKRFINLSLLILSVLFNFTSWAQEETTHVKISESVPDFTFEKSPGVKQTISELRGKTILITFFATWCGPCRKELPHIQSDVFNKYKKNQDFELLIFGREHNWDEVTKFKTENKFTMSFYPDPERQIYSKFAGQYIPRNFLISPEGKILYSSIGFEKKDFNLLKEMIENQLKKK